MTIKLAELYPFYEGFRAKQSWKQGGQFLVEVECGCKGQMVPGDANQVQYLMELCSVHEQAQRTQ